MVGFIIHRTSVAVFIANSSRRARWPIGKTPPDPAAEVGDPNLAGSPAHASLKGPVCSGDAAIRVSVIVPAYNNADELSQCLSALRTATGAESELIVVDDASNDDVSSTAARFGARFLRLARNAAPPPRNHGARHARGQILFFVDADVVVPTTQSYASGPFLIATKKWVPFSAPTTRVHRRWDLYLNTGISSIISCTRQARLRRPRFGEYACGHVK